MMGEGWGVSLVEGASTSSCSGTSSEGSMMGDRGVGLHGDESWRNLETALAEESGRSGDETTLVVWGSRSGSGAR